MSFEDLRSDLLQKRQQRDALQQRFQRGRETERTLEARLARLERLALEDSDAYAAAKRRLQEIRTERPQLRAELVRARTAAGDLLVELAELEPPQVAVSHLDDRTPFLLLPVRLETRYQRLTDAETGSTRHELWLRIYPDDIHIDSHEEVLTEDEVEAARTYWTEIWRAGGDPDRELGAWRTLMSKYGSTRAAWIVRTYRPNNELNEAGESNRPAAPLEEGDALEPGPVFDPYEPKQESWSRAPEAVAMPDRFVAVGFAGGKKLFEQVGAPVPDPLIAGPNPSHPPDEDEGFREDAETLEVDAEMKWMVDFEEAVRMGMGMRIPLGGAEAPPAIDRLLVLGLRLSADADQGRALLENLIESHHYAVDGLSLIPQGTATNNTGSDGAGFKTFELGDDDTYRIELGEPLFVEEPDWKRRRDGQHLAEALGIDYAPLQHLAFADGRDRRDARAMNTALWPATLGYFLEEMMDPLFSEETVGAARDYFLRYVSGRGPLPALRVGTQPYGILAASSWQRWRFPAVDTAVAALFDPRREFERRLYPFLSKLDDRWQELAEQVSHAGAPGDPQQNLLDILGLHASSAEFHQRFAVTLEQLSNMLKLKQLDRSAVDIEALLRAAWSDILEEFGAEPGAHPEIFRKIFYKAQTALNGPLVDDPPLSENKPVAPLSQDDENYLEWLATSPIDTVRRQDFGRRGGEAIAPPRALLYLMLRHAVMNAYWDAAWNFHLTAKSLTTPPRKEPAFLYLRDESPGESKFSLLYRSAGELSRAHPGVFPEEERTVAEQISVPDVIRLRPESRSLREVREALECLQDRPTAVLARAFAEHLDLCSYRLDAWKRGVYHQRLEDLRGSGSSRRLGVYLGAYGWLENLRPGSRLVPFRGDAPEEFRSPDDPPLQSAPDNAGHIHAPSLNHAVTAAILRNAHLTHAGEEELRGVTAVKLTSERVRQALSIVEGVRNGQTLGALLGYQFERGLHDRYEEAEVDRFIFPLRKKFPLVGDRLNPTPDDVPIEAIEARNVIDGLALVRHMQETAGTSYPFGFSDLPDASPAQARVINSEAGRLRDLLDAVADLLTAESVHQVVLGNFDRAGATLDALSRGDLLPEPEIVRTPRSGHTMAHRLCIQFETGIPAADRNPFPGRIDLTPRAEAEPGINRWLARLFGDPDTIVCKVVRIEPGAGPGGEDVEHDHTVSLTELNLQPIDLLYIFEQELEQAASELDRRIAHALLTREDLGSATRLRIEYTAPADETDRVTLFELMPLLQSLRALVVESRALNAEDLVLPSDEPKDLDPDAAPDPNPKGWNVADIRSRVQAARDGLAQLKTDLDAARGTLSAAAPASSDFREMRRLLLLAAAHGVQQSVPETATEETEAAATGLVAQAGTVVDLIDERLGAYDALAPPDPSASSEEQVQAWLAAGGAILGSAFTWMPTFQLKLPEELEKAHGDSGRILRHAEGASDFPVDDWLHGLARVRPKARAVEELLLMAENFERPAPALTPMQLPYKPDDVWLALGYPQDYDFDGDRLLPTVIFAAPFDKTKAQAGLLIDEWTETAPTRGETTGLAFHYNAPNSEPPNAVLLAVTPDITGSWEWEDLIATLNETLDEAAKRAVEPRHLDETRLAQFLPAVMVPATRYLITVATNLLANVEAKYTVTATLPPSEETP